MTNITRRKILKTVHWTMVPLVIWFILIGPPEAHRLGTYGFLLHSNLALLFVILCLGWTANFVMHGMETKRSPRLPQWAQMVHWWMHRFIVWGLFLIALGGFLLGLTSERLLKAGQFLPFAPPMGFKEANALVGFLHITQFYAFGFLIVFHAAFHIWRHYWLRDNALRIMVPKKFHKYL